MQYVLLCGFGAPCSGCLILDSKVITPHPSPPRHPQVFAGLLVGAMLPFWFSAMTMKSVGKAALAMVQEVRRQFNTTPGLMEGTTRPDYR